MSDVPECDFRTEGCSSSYRLGAPSQAEAPRTGALHDFAQFERQQGTDLRISLATAWTSERGGFQAALVQMLQRKIRHRLSFFLASGASTLVPSEAP